MNKETEDEREERILEQLKLGGRIPTPPPGHFHSPRKKAANRSKDRRKERQDLKTYRGKVDYDND